MKRIADTNVIVRLLVKDDEAQLKRALEALDDGVLIVQPTVLLETEWVLRGVLAYRRSDVEKAFVDLLALPNIVVLNEDRVVQAVSLYRSGMDFADALHLVSAAEFDELVTFDRDFVRRAGRANGVVPVRLL